MAQMSIAALIELRSMHWCGAQCLRCRPAKPVAAPEQCGDNCCAAGEACQEGICTGCDPEKLCLSNTECCSAEESCLAIGCCPTERVCGASCCVGEEVCFIDSGVCGLPVE
jgi:hypothetical protein